MAKVVVSYFDIYCGWLYDLLNKRNELKAREDAKQNLHIVGLTKYEINKYEDLMEIISIGNNERVISSTWMNLDSSRSHAILTLELKGLQKNHSFTFIDLAGNERGADTFTHTS